MMDLVLAPQNTVFTVALAVMLAIALMEGVASLLGAGLSEVVDALMPEMDVDADMDVDAPSVNASAATRFLSWLRVGQVPVLILFVIFLTAFGLTGLVLQSVVDGTIGGYLPGWMMAVPAFFVALPVVRVLGGALAYVMPKDETDAVAEATFIGRVAVITLGEASAGSPAEAKLKDRHGNTHYVMVEPDDTGDRFARGDNVLVTQKNGAVFKVIRAASEALVD